MSCLGLFTILISFIIVLTTKNPKTLVFVKDEYSKYEYSLFFKSLKKRGHKLVVKSSNIKGIKLREYGEMNFDNLIVLDTQQSKLSDLSYKNLLEFIDNGGNVMIGLNQKSSDIIKKFVDRCGIEIHSSNSMVLDHFNYDIKKGDIFNDVIITDNICEYTGVIPKDNDIKYPILYKGVGLSLKKHNHLGFSILSGNINTFSIKNDGGPPEKNIISSGNELSLISALQTRVNSRITIIGSNIMLTNEYFNTKIYSNNGKIYDKTGNKEFINYVSKWTFCEVSILKADNIKHYKLNDNTINPNRYRIKDDVLYSLDILEYKLDCDCWKPFISNDIQFEFIRLDPFIRQPLKHEGNGHYSIQFKLPDVFGIYKFTVDYKRYGLSYLFTEDIVSVRPFRHDEYKRFIPMAYPYYMSTFSMIFGFILFTFVFLWGHKDGIKIW